MKVCGISKINKRILLLPPTRAKDVCLKKCYFLKNEIISGKDSGSMIELSKIQEPQNSMNRTYGIEHILNAVGVEMETQSTLWQPLHEPLLGEVERHVAPSIYQLHRSCSIHRVSERWISCE